MNLLELQVLAVVSRIPNGNDAPSPEFFLESAAAAFTAPVEVHDTDSAPVVADHRDVKRV